MDAFNNFWIGLLLAAVFGLLGWRLGAIDAAGCMTGVTLSMLIVYGFGIEGFALVAVFVILGSAATRFGYASKARQGIAQSKKGRRGATHAIANLAAASLCALFSRLTQVPHVWQAAYVAAVAAALADTLSTELGQVFGARPALIGQRKIVSPGTPGAVSWQGLVAGMCGSIVIAVAAVALKLMSGRLLPRLLLAVLLAQLIESLLGEWSVRAKILSNPLRNLAVTTVSALFMWVFAGSDAS